MDAKSNSDIDNLLSAVSAEDLRKFQENFLCEREDWSAEDLCLNDCFELIEKAMNSPLMAKEFGGL